MRLLDQIAQSTKPFVLRDNWGKVAAFDGVPQASPTLTKCPLRYVLDETATAQCRDLVLGAREMFLPDDPFLRVPSERFWMEWFSNTTDGQTSELTGDQRMGALVTADQSGRRGECRVFWTAPTGPQAGEATLRFDLDHDLMVPSGSKTSFRFIHDELDHLNPLFRRVLIEVDPHWSEFISDWPEHEFRRKVNDIAKGSWWCMPLILSFSAMLNSGGLLDERKSDLQRLNASRIKAKRAPLLDHTEIGMRLGYSNVAKGLSVLDGERQTPRLHYVRGHLVRRAGLTFWRTSHLRGDAVKPMVPRTVRFNGTLPVQSESRTFNA